MPRSSVALTPEPLSGDSVVAAAEACVDEKLGARSRPSRRACSTTGAVLQIVAGDDVVLSVLRPRLLPRLDEVERLLPGVTAARGHVLVDRRLHSVAARGRDRRRDPRGCGRGIRWHRRAPGAHARPRAAPAT